MNRKSLLLGGLAAFALTLASVPAQALWLQNSSSYTIDGIQVINHDGSMTRDYLRSGGYFIPGDGGDIPKQVNGSCYYGIELHLQDFGYVDMNEEDLCGDVEFTDDYIGDD